MSLKSARLAARFFYGIAGNPLLSARGQDTRILHIIRVMTYDNVNVRGEESGYSSWRLQRPTTWRYK